MTEVVAGGLFYEMIDGLSLVGVQDGVLKTFKAPFRPYFFVREMDYLTYDTELKGMGIVSAKPTDLRTVKEREKVVRLETEIPNTVGSVASKLEEMGVRTYESDIMYARRVFVDNAFQVEYKLDNVIYLDVELDDRGGFLDYGLMPFLSYAYYLPDKKKFDCITIFDVETEYDLIVQLLNLLAGRTVIVGWNVGFDVNHVKLRFKNVRKTVKSKGRLLMTYTLLDRYLRDVAHAYDLREEYKKTVKGLSSYSLAEVAEYEGISRKIEREGRVADLSKEQLVEYNLRDVEILVELNEKYKFLERDMYLAKEINLPMVWHSAGTIGDTLILRRLRELGYVAPRVVKKQKKSYEGALVLDPKPGLYEMVACCDVVSLYPTVVLVENVDIDGFNGEVVPYLVGYFFKRKEEEGAKGNMAGRETYKLLANAIYGLFGYEFFRFFNEEKAAFITRKGRETLGKIIDTVTDLGLEVLYGDTDSVFFRVEGVGNPEAIVDVINEQIKPYRLKLEMVFEKLILYGYEGEGVKKRYVGIAGGKWKFRGIEIRRSDWCQLSKEVLMECIRMVFEGKTKRDIEAYLADIRRRLFRGEFDDKLAITKSVRPEKEYKTFPKHYLLWRKGVESGKIPKGSREVTYYLSRSEDDEVGKLKLWTDGKKDFDYGEYWEKQIMPPVERLLKSVFGSKRSSLLDFY